MAHDFLVKDIALQAGLSTATVDRVVNRRGGVRKQTAARVEAAIGELREQETVPARRLREAGFEVKAYEDLTLMIWEKFLCNVTLSAPTAVFDMTVGELMADEAAWAVALGCTAEAYRAGVAAGVAFPFDDPVRYVSEFAATIPDASPSMRLDHRAGRRSEVDVINGAVVDLSRELGLEAPYNQTLCAVLRRREAAFG